MGEDLISIGEQTARSSLLLTIGQGFSTLVGGVLTILIARILKPEGYGLYSIALIPVFILGIVRDWGITAAATRYIARDLEVGKKDVSKYVSTTIFFESVSGVTLTVLLIVFSNVVASKFLGKVEASFFIRYAALILVFQGIFLASYSILNGFGAVKYIAFSQMFGSILRATVTLYLLLTGWGVLGAIIGFLSYFILTGPLSLFFAVREAFRNNALKLALDLRVLKRMILFGLPLMVNGLFETIGIQSLNAYASQHSTYFELGNYFAATAILSIVIVFNFPLIQSLLQGFSRVDAYEKIDSLSKAFSTSINFSVLLLVPTVMGIVGLSKPLIYTIYGFEYNLAIDYLIFLSFAYITLALGLVPMTSLLVGTGNTKYILIGKGASFAIGIPLAIFLIPKIKIWGVIFAIIVIYYLSLTNFYILIRRKFGFRINVIKTLKVLSISLIVFATLYIYSEFAIRYMLPHVEELINRITLNLAASWSNEFSLFTISAIGGIIGFFEYTFLISIFRGINLEELNILKMISRGLGPFGKILRLWIYLVYRVGGFHEG